MAAIVLTAAMTAAGLLAVSAAYGGSPPAAAHAPFAVASSLPSSHPPGMPTPSGPTPNPSALPPTAPTGLVVTSVTPRSVTLRWTASRPGCCEIRGYEIRSARAFHDAFSSVNVGNVTTATLTSQIEPGTQIRFSVVARDSAGNDSLPSNGIELVTPVADTGPDTTPPGTPTNLVSTDVAPGTSVLSWSPATDNVGVVGYDVYRFDGWYTTSLVATVAGTTYPAPVAHSPQDRFYVRAVDAAGNLSMASNTVASNTATPGPTTPSVSPVGCRVTYTTMAEWPSGFVAGMTITNTGSTAIRSWTVTFGFGGDQRIASSWNSTFTQPNAAAAMRNAAWNGLIAPGGSTRIGMQGAWTTSNRPPTDFRLNGAPCAVG